MTFSFQAARALRDRRSRPSLRARTRLLPRLPWAHRGTRGSRGAAHRAPAADDEKRLQRERRGDVQLEAPTRLEHGLDAWLRRRARPGRGVLGEVRGPVGVEDGARCADRRGEQVPVPAGEQVECLDDLLALGPPRDPSRALLPLTRSSLARLRPPRGSLAARRSRASSTARAASPGSNGSSR